MAIRREFQNLTALVLGVGNEKISVRIKRNPIRMVKSGCERGPPAVRSELENSSGVRIGDEEIAGGVERHSFRRVHSNRGDGHGSNGDEGQRSGGNAKRLFH